MSRLVRSRTDRIIGGVCAGIGSYFGIDPVIVRLLFVVLALTTGLTFVLYPIMWVIMPEVTTTPLPPGARFDPQTGQPLQSEYPTASASTAWDAPSTTTTTAPPRPRILALVLVGVGGLVLANQIGSILNIDIGSLVIPVALIGMGIYLLRGSR